MNDKFIEYKKTYFGETKIFQCRLAEKKSNELVIIYEISAPVRFLDTNFLPGSKSYGYYWTKKNYNVYHWLNPDDKSLVFYFNISKDTKILDSSVEWQDLIVDIVAFPDGKTMVLDEHEVPRTMSVDDISIIEKTKDEIFSNLKQIIGELERRTSVFVQSFS